MSSERPGGPKDESNEAIRSAVYAALDAFNAEPGRPTLAKDPHTVLSGVGSSLDSIDLVTLIAAIEENVEDGVGKAITIADDRAMSQKHSPFRTVGTLIDYVAQLVSE